eukprot:6471257-Amphidinium_carterae.1
MGLGGWELHRTVSQLISDSDATDSPCSPAPLVAHASSLCATSEIGRRFVPTVAPLPEPSLLLHTVPT